MKLQKIKRIFFNWLKSKGIYEAYKLARHNTNHLVGDDRGKNPYYRCHLIPEQFINHAFTWRSTHEGHNFWYAVNFEWRRYLREIKADPRYQ